MTACPLDPATAVPITETDRIGISLDLARLVAKVRALHVVPEPECWCPGGSAGERCRTRKGRAVPDHVGRKR